jgi:hypothetical protein
VSTAKGTETLCVLATDGQRAGELRAAAERALRGGATRGGTRWAQLLTDVRAEVSGHAGTMVKITATPIGEAVGIFTGALRSRETDR